VERDSKQEEAGYIYHELTRSLCPECMQLVDAKVVIQDNKVIMKKWCPQHGDSEVLVSSDAEYHIRAAKYNRPGRRVERPASKRSRGCPFDCGICPDHEQHVCVGLIDITDKCNMRCPTCFAASKGGSCLSLDQVAFMLDSYVQQEGDPTVLQVSGGEPTEHPQVLEILKMALDRCFKMVMLNTNGLRLAKDRAFMEELSNIEGELEVYLQFDSLRPETTKAIRGGNYLDLKLEAVRNCQEFGIPMHLACTVVKGQNDDELGDLVRFGVETDGVRGINFQPAICSGRFDHVIDPMDRTTLPDVILGIEDQTDGMFRRSDFQPLPCSHPTCIGMTYAWIKRGKVKPIPRYVEMDRYMDYMANSIFLHPHKAYKDALQNLFSMSTVMSSTRTLLDFSCVCGSPFRRAFFDGNERRKLQDQKLFRIMIIQFEDKHNFDMKRVKKCCIGNILPDGKIVPFCTYNTLYREENEVSKWVGQGAPGVSDGNLEGGLKAGAPGDGLDAVDLA